MREAVKYVIFEDEYYTMVNLKSIMSRIRPNYQLVSHGESIDAAVSILNEDAYDLAISSMQLSDGCCVDAFLQAKSSKPVILMAEYKDNGRVRKLNVVDYIFKPISAECLLRSILKFERNNIQ